jgi:hypothetical protein
MNKTYADYGEEDFAGLEGDEDEDGDDDGGDDDEYED